MPAALGMLGASLALTGSPPAPARAGLLTPVLQLMRPQLETRLAKVCVETAAGGNTELRRSLVEPCQQLAVPTSRCLIEETDSSGRGLGVVTELLSGRFGDDSEVVVKRCLARLFGIPANSLRDVRLRDLGRHFGSRQVGGDGP
jgi:hypothetical protein